MFGFLAHRQVRADEWRQFAFVGFMFVLGAVMTCMPESVMAAGFDGSFGPDKGLVTNTDSSLLAWWKAIAGWGLWVAIAFFLVSILFAGGKMWWIPVAIFLVCLFGEMTVSGVKKMAFSG